MTALAGIRRLDLGSLVSFGGGLLLLDFDGIRYEQIDGEAELSFTDEEAVT